jgi:cell division control protein 6
MDGEDPLRIVLKPEILSEDYLPETLQWREGAVREITNCLLPLARRQRPFNAWIHGPSGSGKSASAKRAAEDFLKAHGVGWVAVNCWKFRTFYSVVDEILNQSRVVAGESRDSRYKLDILERRLESPTVVILVEVDQVLLSERNVLLYNLGRLPNVATVCTTETPLGLLDLHPRVRDTFYPRVIAFDAYTDRQVLLILRARANEALAQQSWNLKMMEEIANRAGGNARFALQALRSAANTAEVEGCRFIERRHMEAADRSTTDLRRLYVLKTLSDHHKLLYSIVEKERKIHADELWGKFASACKDSGLEPIVRRTVRKYIQHMGGLGIFDLKPSKVRGGVYVVSLRGIGHETRSRKPWEVAHDSAQQ